MTDGRSTDPAGRRAFLRRLGTSVLGLAAAPFASPFAAGLSATPLAAARALTNPPAAPVPGRAPTARSEFVFARLRYDSGDWDYNPKVCANVLDAVLQYTQIPVHDEEVVITADSAELLAFPFLFMTGHTLVRFNDRERAGLVRYVRNGGLLFSDDCNHDVEGLYAKSFEAEMRRAFGNATSPGSASAASAARGTGPDDIMPKIPTSHPLYSSFFRFPEGPPQTSHELNGWGDDMVHDYMRGIEHAGRLGVIYSNKDYGCEWDYDWRNKRFRSEDNTRFAVNLVVYAMT